MKGISEPLSVDRRARASLRRLSHVPVLSIFDEDEVGAAFSVYLYLSYSIMT